MFKDRHVMRTVIKVLVPRTLRNWLRRPSASLRWCAHELQFRFGGPVDLELRHGWTLRCHPAAARAVRLHQIQDPDQVEEFDYFISKCTAGMVLFDVGAHFGVFSLAGLHYGGVTAQVIALDPSPVACRLLRLHARLNGFKDRLRVVQAAAAAVDGTLDLVDAGVGGLHYQVLPESGHRPNEMTPTKAVTLDELARTSGLRPTHIKIDVEAAELAALEGSREVLSQANPPVLFLELHTEMIRRRGGNPLAAVDYLTAQRYRLFGMDGQALTEQAVLEHSLVRVYALRSDHERCPDG